MFKSVKNTFVIFPPRDFKELRFKVISPQNSHSGNFYAPAPVAHFSAGARRFAPAATPRFGPFPCTKSGVVSAHAA